MTYAWWRPSALFASKEVQYAAGLLDIIIENIVLTYRMGIKIGFWSKISSVMMLVMISSEMSRVYTTSRMFCNFES